MSKPKLGTLVKLPLRDFWKHESRDFTPWLAGPANIRLLGEAIGLELEVEAVERSVGPFFADILCKDVGSDTWVLVENQLEPTDHTHLGQLMTYAAGLEAKTIIWIAERFTSEHRAALDWLNEISSTEFNFFGVELELWRIAESLPAPKFNVVSQPNDWSRAVQASTRRGELTPGQEQQFAFWTEYKQFMETNSDIRCPKPRPQAWMNHAIGRTDFHLTSIASTFDSESNSYGGELRVELVLDGPTAKPAFQLLEAQKLSIEQSTGVPLVWHNPSDRNMCRIYVRQAVSISDRDRWPEFHAWLKQRLEMFHRVFADRVKQLSL